MIELGKVQKLEVLRMTSVGAYLGAKNGIEEDDVLLPQNQVTEDIEVGDDIEVFIYKDSEDRRIATTRKPKLTLGEIAPLKVVEITKIGAFLDWGLEKDLFLPFREQTSQIKKGGEYLIGLYLDKSSRLCGTMDVYSILSSDSPYKEDDRVEGIIYSLNANIGAFVAVDNKYHGLIPRDELHGRYNYKDKVEARVIRVREDGKLDLSLREKAYKQMDEDAVKILEKLIKGGGVLRLHDKSSPEEIKAQLNISKNAFKRAVGRLLKDGKIQFVDGGIKLIDK